MSDTRRCVAQVEDPASRARGHRVKGYRRCRNRAQEGSRYCGRHQPEVRKETAQDRMMELVEQGVPITEARDRALAEREGGEG